SPMATLPSEASCPICLELFRDPVSIHCGHTFCRGCISRLWEWGTGQFPCPRCRETAPERSLRPSRELARLLDIARRLSRGDTALARRHREEEEEGEEEEGGCPKHQEPLELFCREDRALLCAICRESRAHRGHTLLPVPLALREFRDQLQARLQTLRDDRDKLLELREAEMSRNWEYLEKTGSERQRLLWEFQELRESLEDHSRRLLEQLRELEREGQKEQEENLTLLTQEISRLDSRVQELEQKRREPAGTFLRDIGGALSGFPEEKFQPPPSPLPELEKKIGDFREKNLVLEETLRSFRVQVTLDPSTAHPQLLVSPDGSSVTCTDPQDAPEEGPGPDPSVLGHPGVTSGHRCWDVEVSPEGSWALGVAGETLGDGAEPPESPGAQLWSLGRCQGHFWALTSLERVPLGHPRVSRRLRVALDYDRGQVTFFDAESRSRIFAFPEASFRGLRLRPWFLVWGEGARV
ncbi:TRI27 protein, partial [Pitta sordida]|nr:TRI27 protein [Pitta sordida]